MTQLPVDIWWIILKMVWKDSRYCFIIKNYNGSNYKFFSYLYGDIKIIGKFVTSDLYLMRNICKTTKKMVDKYSKRFKSGQSYYLIFPYEK